VQVDGTHLLPAPGTPSSANYHSGADKMPGGYVVRDSIGPKTPSLFRYVGSDARRERAPWPMPRAIKASLPLNDVSSPRSGVDPLPRSCGLHRVAKFMAESVSRTRKSKPRGRPPTGAESIHLRLLPDQMAALDQWIARQPDMPSRPEAIRRLFVLGLSVTAKRR
jgi:hypothetical protein